MGTKVNQLLQDLPARSVATLSWLRARGVDRRLADRYVRSGWLARLGHGAYIRAGVDVDWPGAVSALQTQLCLEVHPGAITAIELRGYAHYLALGNREVILFATAGTRLPRWFRDRSWSRPIKLVTTRVFPDSTRATSTYPCGNVEVGVATLERAAFEMLYLVPKRQSYQEALQVLEGLRSLRPGVVQRLLETCTSVKTKRLLMHCAERSDHPWLSRLDLSRVDFGSGKRTIHPGGRLDGRYELVVADASSQ